MFSKLKSFVFSFSIILLVSSCSDPSKEIIATWQLSSILPDDVKASNDQLLLEAEQIFQPSHGLLLSLFKDSTFTQISGSGEYNHGKWYLLDGKKIVFDTEYPKDEKNPTDALDFDFIKRDNEKYLALKSEKLSINMSYKKIAIPLEDFKKDPYHPNNNKWRIKAEKKESIVELEIRLTNYFRHLALIFKAADERKQDYTSWEYSPGIAKIYKNAVGIIPKDQLKVEDLNFFYDESDALVAYDMFQSYLRNSRYKGPPYEKFNELIYNILLGIYSDAHNGKFKSTYNGQIIIESE